MSDLTLTSGHAARKEQSGAYPNILISLVFLAATLTLASPAMNSGIFDALSTDDAMRLVEVRDLIGGQGWFDLFQYRLDPPGTSMHWSRLIDAPLAALILLLKPIVLVGAFLSLFSGCIASPYSHLDPIVTSLWVNNVAESISFARMLQLFPEKVLAAYGLPIMAMGLAVMALMRSPAPERFRWMVGIVTLAALTGLGFWEVRGTAGATLLAAPVFLAGLTILWPGFASGRNLLLLSVIASPLCLLNAGLWAKPLLDSIFKREEIGDPSPCRSLSDVASLKRLPKGRVMAPIDLGPAILAETTHDVFAAPYHRNNDGNAALIKLMLAPLPTARQILSDHRVDYLITCSAATDRNVIKLAPEGLEARLGRGETPDFLVRLDLDPAPKISVWRVRN